MTNPKQKQMIYAMREDGMSFVEIASYLNIPTNTAKSIYQRERKHHNNTSADLCKNCGALLVQHDKGKPRIFCSDTCRFEWWNKNRANKPYRNICVSCGKEFISFGNKHKKYCSRECYKNSNQGDGLP